MFELMSRGNKAAILCCITLILILLSTVMLVVGPEEKLTRWVDDDALYQKLVQDGTITANPERDWWNDPLDGVEGPPNTQSPLLTDAPVPPILPTTAPGTSPPPQPSIPQPTAAPMVPPTPAPIEIPPVPATPVPQTLIPATPVPLPPPPPPPDTSLIIQPPPPIYTTLDDLLNQNPSNSNSNNNIFANTNNNNVIRQWPKAKAYECNEMGQRIAATVKTQANPILRLCIEPPNVPGLLVERITWLSYTRQDIDENPDNNNNHNYRKPLTNYELDRITQPAVVNGMAEPFGSTQLVHNCAGGSKQCMVVTQLRSDFFRYDAFLIGSGQVSLLTETTRQPAGVAPISTVGLVSHRDRNLLRGTGTATTNPNHPGDET